MAENLPNLPSGAVPPRPAEAAKVQPKKETVRINLPPKPTAAPTIKLPTPAAAPAQAAAPPTAAPAVPASGPVASATAPAQRPVSAAAPRAPMAPRPAMAGPGVSGTDQILALVAAVVSILALVRLLFL